MKRLFHKKIFYISNIFILILNFNCTENSKKYEVENFKQEDLKWFKPFNKNNDTVIYISGNNETDTLIFHQPLKDSDSTRSFEQGYSNADYLTVPYDITLGSYHKFALTGDGVTRCTQNFANLAKSSSGYGNLEIIFIGTLFSDENLKKIKKLNDSLYFFSGKYANYRGISVEKGINDFLFNTNIGVVEYTDYRNIVWKRK